MLQKWTAVSYNNSTGLMLKPISCTLLLLNTIGNSVSKCQPPTNEIKHNHVRNVKYSLSTEIITNIPFTYLISFCLSNQLRTCYKMLFENMIIISTEASCFRRTENKTLSSVRSAIGPYSAPDESTEYLHAYINET